MNHITPKACTEQDCPTVPTKGNLCDYHKRAMQTYGHPKALPLKRKDYLTELTEVQTVFNTNSDNPNLVTTLEALTQWLASAATDEWLGQEAVIRLRDSGVTPLEILIEATAVYTHYRRNPNELQSDSVLSAQLVNSIMRLAPLAIKVSSVSGSSYRTKLSFPLRTALAWHWRVILDPFFGTLTFGAVKPSEESKSNLINILKRLFSNWFRTSQAKRSLGHV